MLPILYIVLPCYNEEEVLAETATRLLKLMTDMIDNNEISNASRAVFVDDGSRDNTWNIIVGLSETEKLLTGIKLASNAGHQNALLAGIHSAHPFADCIISVDADLQDDINVIHDFIKEYKNGAQIVYGVRSKRATDTFFKRFSAQLFYKLMQSMGVDIVFDHADYRLLGKRAVEALLQYNEVNIFLRGIVPLLGYKTAKVYYERAERFAGQSKYPLKKMLGFAIEGITSFSVTPIKFVTITGLISVLISVIVGLYAIIQAVNGQTVTGWASTVLSIWFLGGTQLMAIGLVGEYVGKIYKEVKRRPRFIVETSLLKHKGKI